MERLKISKNGRRYNDFVAGSIYDVVEGTSLQGGAGKWFSTKM